MPQESDSSEQSIEVRPSSKSRHVFTLDGLELEVPQGWALLEPGDAALSRRIKKDGRTLVVKEKKGRKMFSRGIWAPANRIDALRSELEIERQDPAYERKLEAGRKRREKEQAAYEEEFLGAVYDFLDFAPRYAKLAVEMAQKITKHAVPVGSGTVARTQRIPVDQRAEAATIAWMRHQTTAYDHMTIPREKGKRREVRRMLAQRSKQLLQAYRVGSDRTDSCPLQMALSA